MSNARAYLVGYFNRESGKFEGIGMYSEERPTCSSKFQQVTMLEGFGKDYQEGIDHLKTQLHDPHTGQKAYGWMAQYMDDRTLQELGLTRSPKFF